MSELYSRGIPAPASQPSPPATLPGFRDLSDSQRTLVWIDEVTNAIDRFQDFLSPGVDVPSMNAVVTCYNNPESGLEAFRRETYRLHLVVGNALTSLSFKLGKAYGLGQAMGELCRASVEGDLKQLLTSSAIDRMEEDLSDLATELPNHASRATSITLGRWREWARGNNLPQSRLRDQRPEQVNATDARQRFARQARIWRSLLSGEKNATDMLEAEAYAKAAESVIKRSAKLFGQYLASAWPVLTAAILMIAVGAGILYTASRFTGTVAFIVAAAGALGITGQSLRTTLGTLAGKLETPLWKVELDEACAVAADRSPFAKQPTQITRASGPLKTTLVGDVVDANRRSNGDG